MRPVRLIFLATVALAATVRAAPTTQPTTLPIDAVATVTQLADRDPATRVAARSALMSLDAAALPALRDALAGVTLTRGQANVLRDAVIQVFLVDKHRFEGIALTGGKLGISVCSAENDVPIVGARMPGWDGYRALQDGDAILAIRPPVGSGAARPAGETMQPIGSLHELLALLTATRPGDHVVVRVLRNGIPLDVDLRVAIPMEQQLPDGVMRNHFIPDADKYWQTQFAPGLRIAGPTTRAVQ